MANNEKKIGSIIRLDKDEGPKRVGTHGWQVRFPTGVARKYHSKLFSDSMHGGKDEARAAAEKYYKEYLAKYEADIKASQKPFRKRPPSNNTSGRVGVYRSHNYTVKGFRQEFWGAFCPQGPDGSRFTKVFYVYSNGEEEAKRLAIEFREMWEEAALKGPKALRKFFDDYHSGYLS